MKIRKLFQIIFVFLIAGMLWLFYVVGNGLIRGNNIQEYSIIDREILCEKDSKRDTNYPVLEPLLLGSNNKNHFQLKLDAINGITTYWEVITNPNLVDKGTTFASFPNNPVTLTTLPVELSKEGYVIQHKSKFSFSFLPNEKYESNMKVHPIGVYPVAGSSIITQTKGGSFLREILDLDSHNMTSEEYAVDIASPLGSDVLAFDSGIVVWKEDGFGDYGCANTQDIPRGNSITILHENGLESIYLHLKKGSIIFEVGDEVKRGQYIAKVGNSGNSNKPHLHFQLGGMTEIGMRSVPVMFQTAELEEPLKPKFLKRVSNLLKP